MEEKSFIVKVEFDVKEATPCVYTVKFDAHETITNCLTRIANKAMLKVTKEELQEKYALLLLNSGKYQYLTENKTISECIDEEKIRVGYRFFPSYLL
jgi:predicted transcriptional regulator